MALFLPGHERSATAEALTDCRVITLDQSDFEKLLKDAPGISLRIIQTLAHRLQAANRQIKTLALGDDARLMHAMPVRRNLEVADDALDAPFSAVIDEAENRLHTAKAVLLALLEGR